MNSRLGLTLMAMCLILGCEKTYRPRDGSAPALAVHPLVTTAEPGTRQCFANPTGDGNGVYFFFPDRQLAGVRVESVNRQTTSGSNYVVIQWAAGDKDRILAFVAAHPNADRFGFRFESTPVESKSQSAIFQAVNRSELTGEFPLRFARPFPEEADFLALQLVGR